MRETFTFSRALHLMRYVGKKVRISWFVKGCYLHIEDGAICTESGTVVSLTSSDILSPWMVYDEELDG